MEKFDQQSNLLTAARKMEREKAKEDFQVLLFLFGMVALLGAGVLESVVFINSHFHLF